MNRYISGKRVLNSKNGNFYTKVIMSLTIPVLLYYSWFCISVQSRYIIGYADLVTAAAFIFDIIYIHRNKVFYKNLILSITAFFLLCILTPLANNGDHIYGRMWLMLLPGIILFTQRSRRSFALVLSVPGMALLIQLVVSIVKYPDDLRMNIEQFLVYIMITIMTYAFSKAVSEKTEEIELQHYYNKPTGLPNKNLLNESVKTNGYHIVAIIDMDGFKNINSLYGETVGNKVIIEISNRLKHFVKDQRRWTLYKLHSDEFAIHINNSKGVHREIPALRELLGNVDSKITMGLFEIYPSISIGVGHGMEHVIEDAGIALKDAKKYRKDIMVFDKSFGVREQFKKDLAVVYKLKSGLKSDGIVPYFQPIINLKTGESVKYECLARLNYNQEIIPPENFIDISKEAKVYSRITKAMITKSFEFFSGINQNFSINIDWLDIMDEDICRFIYNKIDQYKIGHLITFELLESEEVREPDKMLKFIDVVKDKGCKIAIDDFGSGFSNFDYLLKFKVDYLKIDGSLIKNIDVDKKSYVLTKSIVLFASELGIKTIAEHIDKESILRILKDLGVDYGQGYYWSAPEPVLGYVS